MLLLSPVWLFETSWTVAHQPLLFMEFPSKNAGVGCLLQGIFISFSTHRLNPCLLHWQADSLPLSHQGSPIELLESNFKKKLYLNKKRIGYFKWANGGTSHQAPWRITITHGITKRRWPFSRNQGLGYCDLTDGESKNSCHEDIR